MRLKLVSVESVAKGVESFGFVADEPITWEAGQYLHYILPHPDTDDRRDDRWFTISSAPSTGKIVLTTRINEGGSSFKRNLAAMKSGDSIEAEGPGGDFVLGDKTASYIFLAGGIGITPFHSILEEARIKGENLDVRLVYANRDEHFAFKQELDGFAKADPGVKIEYLISPQKIDQGMLTALDKSDPEALWYVSGPEPMVEVLQNQLIDMGVSPNRVKTDFFPGYELE